MHVRDDAHNIQIQIVQVLYLRYNCTVTTEMNKDLFFAIVEFYYYSKYNCSALQLLSFYYSTSN